MRVYESWYCQAPFNHELHFEEKSVAWVLRKTETFLNNSILLALFTISIILSAPSSSSFFDIKYKEII